MQSPNLGTIAKNVGETGDLNVLPLAYGGHSYYVRKCKTPEMADGIAMPDSVRERSYWVEVVGKGPNVGRPCNKSHRKEFRTKLSVGGRHRTGAGYLAKCIADVADVGDLLLCPNEDRRIKRTPWCVYEYFIEESCPLAIVKSTDGE